MSKCDLRGRWRSWLRGVVALVVAFWIGCLPWVSLAQDPSPEPTPGPRMEDFSERDITQFARVVALVFLYREDNPNGDIEVYRQETLEACGLSPELYEKMNYVFTGDPDFLYVVTRRISEFGEGEIACGFTE